MSDVASGLPPLPPLPSGLSAVRTMAAHAYVGPGPASSGVASNANLAHALNAVSGVFKMSRSVSTVADLWREWTIGTMGRSVISEYESGRGPVWKLHGGDAERKYYARRKVIIERVRLLARSRGTTEPTVATALDQWCRTNGVSLTGLQDAISKRADTFEAVFPVASPS